MIVVDTSVLIDHLRGQLEARRSLRGALEAGTALAASVLTKIEIVGPMRTTGRQAVRALFSVLDWLPVTEQIADDAGALARRYRRSHGAIDLVDYVIAATTRHHDAQLWTKNVRHFPMLDQLQPPY